MKQVGWALIVVLVITQLALALELELELMELFNDYTYLDGSPCGMEAKE